MFRAFSRPSSGAGDSRVVFVVGPDVEGNGPGLIAGSQEICTQELKKTTKPLKQQSIFRSRFERVTWQITVRNVATRSLRRQHECRRQDNIKTKI